MFVVFIIMYLCSQEKAYVVIPLLLFGIYISFSTSDALNERFQDEISYTRKILMKI
jgi:hypothetical protein